jgi:hypothetical protein
MIACAARRDNVYIRYNIYFWIPPHLTPEEEIQAGRQIVLQGREVFLQKAPYLSNEEQRRIEDAKHISGNKRIILGVVFAALVIPVFVVAWWLLIAVIPVIILSLGSMLHARTRYRNWVDEMISKYAAHAQKQEGQIDAKIN